MLNLKSTGGQRNNLTGTYAFGRIRTIHPVEREPQCFGFNTFKPAVAPVSLWNGFKKGVSQFEIAAWELHLRRPDVLVHNKQPTRLQGVPDLVEQVFELKNMM